MMARARRFFESWLGGLACGKVKLVRFEEVVEGLKIPLSVLKYLCCGQEHE